MAGSLAGGKSGAPIPGVRHDTLSAREKRRARRRGNQRGAAETSTPIYYNRVLFLAHFNAGVRALDVRDPLQPKEIGFYVPAITDKTDKRCVGTGADQRCKTAIQTNNVEVDDRGYIYIVDRANTGMHILQLTGAARQVARFR